MLYQAICYVVITSGKVRQYHLPIGWEISPAEPVANEVSNTSMSMCMYKQFLAGSDQSWKFWQYTVEN